MNHGLVQPSQVRSAFSSLRRAVDWRGFSGVPYTAPVRRRRVGVNSTLNQIVSVTMRTTFLLSLLATSLGVRSANASVDLRISDDETYQRPNSWSQLKAPQREYLYGEAVGPTSRPGVSIAWRNANQVEEAEVRVQNTSLIHHHVVLVRLKNSPGRTIGLPRNSPRERRSLSTETRNETWPVTAVPRIAAKTSVWALRGLRVLAGPRRAPREP